MKQKYYDEKGVEIPLQEQIKLAFYYQEFSVKKDWTNQFGGDAQYIVARNIYKKMSKIFKDSEISAIGMAFQTLEE
jgi:hypothetical protein